MEDMPLEVRSQTARDAALLDAVARIVSAPGVTGDLDIVIEKVARSLVAVLERWPKEATARPENPSVPIGTEVTPSRIKCLECGRGFAHLKRHLRASHGLSPEEYRKRWDLPKDYKIVAANHSARRSTAAK